MSHLVPTPPRTPGFLPSRVFLDACFIHSDIWWPKEEEGHGVALEECSVTLAIPAARGERGEGA